MTGRSLVLRCIGRHGLTKIGSLYTAVVYPSTGAVQIDDYRVTWTAHPILFMNEDGTPENSAAWKSWEIVELT